MRAILQFECYVRPLAYTAVFLLASYYLFEISLVKAIVRAAMFTFTMLVIYIVCWFLRGALEGLNGEGK